MQFNSLLFFPLLFATLLFSLEDLGTYGSTVVIKEKNFMDSIRDKSKDLNATLIKEQLVQGENDYLTVKEIVPTCSKTDIRDFIPTFIAPTDVILPNGTVVARAGETIKTLELMKKNNIKIDKYMMFIDVTDEIQVQLSYMYKNQGLVFVTKGSIKEYERRTKVQTYRADKQSIEKFNVKCSPSLIIQDGVKLVIYEYDPMDLVKDEDDE